MTDQQSYDPHLERKRLLQECQRLIIEVSYRPGCLKLLEGVRQQLVLFSAYKKNRWQ